MITSRYAALVFRVLAAVLIGTGVLRLVGATDGSFSATTFLFYTSQSNLLCLAWMLVLVVVTIRDIAASGAWGASAPAPRVGGAVMMAITVTMLIYLVLLAPAAFQQDTGGFVPFSLTDNLVHIVTPCLMIVDWLLFSPKGRLRWFDPLLWTLLPYAYLVFAFARAAFGGEFGAGRAFPYPFMDVDTHGAGGVALWILALTVALVAVGYVYVGIDTALARFLPRRAQAAATPGDRRQRNRSPRDPTA